MALQLNPAVVKSAIKDIMMQVEYHYAKAKGLPKTLKGLKSIKGAKSWGDLASKASKASKSTPGAKAGDVLPHIKTRYNMYNDPAFKDLKPEFVTTTPLLKTVIGAGAGLGAVGGAAALGAGAIGYNWYKHNKEVGKNTEQLMKNYDSIISSIKRRGKEKKEFRKWYSEVADKNKLNADPYNKKHYYDYEAAYKSGVRKADKDGHWPSKFKKEGHPNMIVDGVNTKTGKIIN